MKIFLLPDAHFLLPAIVPLSATEFWFLKLVHRFQNSGSSGLLRIDPPAIDLSFSGMMTWIPPCAVFASGEQAHKH